METLLTVFGVLGGWIALQWWLFPARRSHVIRASPARVAGSEHEPVTG